MEARSRFVTYLKDKCKHLEVTQDAEEFWKLLEKEENGGPANDFSMRLSVTQQQITTTIRQELGNYS